MGDPFQMLFQSYLLVKQVILGQHKWYLGLMILPSAYVFIDVAFFNFFLTENILMLFAGIFS